MVKRLALIGSSGGGKATLGHEQSAEFMQLIAEHLDRIDCEKNENKNENATNKNDNKNNDEDQVLPCSSRIYLDTILFVSLKNGGSFDSATCNDEATLLYIRDNNSNSNATSSSNSNSNSNSNSSTAKAEAATTVPAARIETTIFQDTLSRINNIVQHFEETVVATKIQNGMLDGLILVSCNPSLLPVTLRAAAERNIPCTGTGGTSLSQLAAGGGATEDGSSSSSLLMNVRLIGNAGGSVGTTPETKAISYACAFAEEWHLEYTPWWKTTTTRKKKNQTIPNKKDDDINDNNNAEEEEASTPMNSSFWKSVLNSCLPGFWSVVLMKKVIITLLSSSSSVSIGEWSRTQYELEAWVAVAESYVLPILCAVTMTAATSAAAAPRRNKTTTPRATNPTPVVHVAETVQLMSAIVAASTCRNTILGGLLVGGCVSVLDERVLYTSIVHWKQPATMTNLLRVGVAIVLALMMLPITGSLRHLTEQYRMITVTYFWDYYPTVVSTTTANSSNNANNSNSSTLISLGYVLHVLLSSLLGLVFCYGSKVGWYHSIFLPMILIEMELGNPSMLGCVDFLTLVVVSAGICLGMILTTPSTEERNLARRGWRMNVLCGDFVEACYPYMARHPVINVASYIASALSVLVLTGGCQSSAYLPFLLSIWLAEERNTVLIAAAIAFCIPFLATIGNHWYTTTYSSPPSFGRKVKTG